MVGPQMCYSLCRNSLPDSKDEFVEGALEASINNNSIPTFTSILAVFYAFTSTSAPIPISFRGTYTNVNFQRATKLVLDLFIQSQIYI